MTETVRDLLETYWQWLKDKTALRDVNGWVEITTPHLDRHNDCIQIYAQGRGNTFTLTDDGYILDDLETSGCSIDTPKRQALLEMTLNGFGVKHREGRLEVTATKESFPIQKHSLLQAMLAVNDLFYLATPFVANLFFEDVVSWLDEADVRYTPRIKLAGKSGYDNVFDFVIPKSRNQPERILNTITQPTRQTATTLVFAWTDTRENRPVDSRAFAILNDSERRVAEPIMHAFREYDITPIPWSERQQVVQELAA